VQPHHGRTTLQEAVPRRQPSARDRDRALARSAEAEVVEILTQLPVSDDVVLADRRDQVRPRVPTHKRIVGERRCLLRRDARCGRSLWCRCHRAELERAGRRRRHTWAGLVGGIHGIREHSEAGQCKGCFTERPIFEFRETALLCSQPRIAGLSSGLAGSLTKTASPLSRRSRLDRGSAEHLLGRRRGRV
jgi:hypothetical protein